MRLLKFVTWLGLLIMVAVPAMGGVSSGEADRNAPPSDCTVLKFTQYGDAISIEKPGRYCIDRDYQSTCGPGPLHYLAPKLDQYMSRNCFGGGFGISAPGPVELDLRGHTLTGPNAIILTYQKNVTIRNGTLNHMNVVHACGNTDVPFPDFVGPGRPEPGAGTAGTYAASDDELKAPVERTQFTLEDVHLIDATVELCGGGNIIRRNHFDMTAKQTLLRNAQPKREWEHLYAVALTNFGPDTLIENNEIRIKSLPSEASGAYGIFVRRGDRDIIRGNKVFVEGHGDTVGIGARTSTDVMLQDNQVTGAKEDICLEGHSNSTSKTPAKSPAEKTQQ